MNNSLMSSHTVQYCNTGIAYVHYASHGTKAVSASLFEIVGLTAFIFSAISVHCILKSNHATNYSMRLFLILGIFECIESLYSIITVVPYIFNVSELSCLVVFVWQFLHHILLFIPTYFVCLIGVDRYLRVKLLQHYSSFWNPLKFNFSIVIMSAIGVCQAFWYAYLPYSRGPGQGWKALIPVMVFLFTINIAFYILSVRKLRQHERNSTLLSATHKSLSKAATAYLLMYLLIYSTMTPLLIIIRLLHQQESVEFIGIVYLIALYVPNLKIIAHSVIFIKYNRQTRELVFEMVRQSMASVVAMFPNLRGRNLIRIEPLA